MDVPEQTLHNQLKAWYLKTGDQLEGMVEGFIVDIVRGDLLIEIQTGNFSMIRSKLEELLKTHKIRLVYPIPERKWVSRVDGEKTSKRRSPKRGRFEEVFNELIYIPHVLANPSFSLEVLLVHMEETLVNNGLGSWRRKGWSIQDRRLLEVVDHILFEKPADYLLLFPEKIQGNFTSKDLAKTSNLSLSLARKMVYCLSCTGIIREEGKCGRSKLYRRSL